MLDYRLTAKPACPHADDVVIGAYKFSEIPLAIASVAAFDDGAAISKLAKHLGYDLPGIERWSGVDDDTVFWTASGQWFVTAPEDEGGNLAAALSEQLGADAAVTDQSGGWAAFDVTGPDLIAVFEKLVGFDIAAAKHRQARRTSIEHVSSFVLCKSSTELRIFCARSFARSLHHAVVQAIQAQIALNDLTEESGR